MTQICPEYEIRTARIIVADLETFLHQLRIIMCNRDTTIVCFNAESMAGMRHAEAALDHALRSFRSGSPIAKTFAMEALLYAAGTRQCAEAADAVGIREGENQAYVCCCPPRPGIATELEPLMQFVDDDQGVPSAEQRARLCRLFSISDDEIAAAGGESRLADLVIERVALLDAYR